MSIDSFVDQAIGPGALPVDMLVGFEDWAVCVRECKVAEDVAAANPSQAAELGGAQHCYLKSSTRHDQCQLEPQTPEKVLAGERKPE